MINKLKDGEIDIAGAMFKNEETMELYDFPEYNSGATYTTLVTLKDNNSINISNYQTLEGIKVGYFETSISTSSMSFMKTTNSSPPKRQIISLKAKTSFNTSANSFNTSSPI